MYDIALSVSACARSGTRADVAWMIAPAVSDDALAFTPGGGRIGVIAGGAFDSLLAETAARQLSTGRLVRHEVNEVEAAVSGIPAGTEAAFLVVPAAQFPAEVWPMLLERRPVIVRTEIANGEVTSIEVQASEPSAPAVEVGDASVTTTLAPVPRLVIAGQGAIAQALAAQGRLLGWKVAVESRPDVVAGLAATLSWLDAIVVMGHDVEPSSRCLMAALESEAGYIGALGSRAMQEQRADWLAYRDITDLSRINGPAGLAIGASSPAEIAVSITAQIIAVRS